MSVSLAHLSHQLARTDRLLHRELGGGHKGAGFASQMADESSSPSTASGGGGAPVSASNFLTALNMLGSGGFPSLLDSSGSQPSSDSSDTDASSDTLGATTSTSTGSDTSVPTPLSGLEQALASLTAEVNSLGQQSTGATQTTDAITSPAVSTTSSAAQGAGQTAPSSPASAAATVGASSTLSSAALPTSSQLTSAIDQSLLTSL